MGLNILAMFSVPDPRPEESDLAVEKRFVRIDARCSYQILGEFLAELHNLPVIVSISGFDLVGRKTILPRLRVELILTTYLTRKE